MINYKMSRYATFFVAAILLILLSISCISATDSNTNISPDQSKLSSEQSLTVTATSDRYVNAKTGNNSWDGTSPTHTSGTVGPKQSISSGLSVSVNSGNLYIAAGTYKENKLTVTKNLTITGEGKTNTTIDATGSNLIFWIKPGVIVTLRNLNITNGTASSDTFNRNGGGIYNEGTLTIDNCVFYNNRGKDASDAGGATGSDASSAGNGGAIYNTNTGKLTITNSEFTSNHAGQGGDASATHHSSSGGSGGAIYNAGLILNIQACTFRNNYAGRGGASSAFHDGHPGGSGGAIYNTGTINNILSCIFTTNHAGTGGYTQDGAAANPGTGGCGGAIGSSGTVTVTNSTFDGNYAGNGGEGTDIQDGATGGFGGAIYNTGTFTISGSEIKNGHTGTGGFGPAAANDGADGNGGAISNMKTLTITNCDIHNNTAYGNGGGVSNSATSSLILQGTQIHDNTANNGAGIFNENQITITNCGTYNNKASNNGGGIWNSATLTLANLTIRNNTAGNTGGGIYNSGILTLNNFTITQNTANYGGGIGNSNKLKLYNSNITSNTATIHGGGIYNTNLIYLVNTQITSNTPDNIYGSLNCVVNNRTIELYNTIQDAINKASSGDTLLIQTGTYKEILSINKNISLIGASYTNTILNGNQKDCCIKISQGTNVYISGLNITNGRNDYELNADGSYLGGGIDNEGGNLSLYQVIISNNFATDKGGGIYNTGNLTINNCTLDSNKVQNYHNNFGGDKTGKADGAGIYNLGTLTVINTKFTNQDTYDTIVDSGYGFGGAIYSNTATSLTVTNCTFKSNYADGGGGAIYAIGTGTFNVSNSTFQSNRAYYEYLEGDDVNLVSTECYGGAIYTTCNLTVTNSIFKSNTAYNGGAIYLANCNLNVKNSTFSSNRAYEGIETINSGRAINILGGYGGAIYNTKNLNMTNCTLNNNVAVYGGAIYSKNSGNLTVSNSSFANNTVRATDKNGDQITVYTLDMTTYQVIETVLAYSQAVAQFVYDFRLFTGSSIGIVIDTTADMVEKISGNVLQATGGAIYLDDSCNLTINNCTFYNNTASIGGGINNLGNGTITITNSNFSKNVAGLGAAIYSSNIGPLFVKDSLFDSNMGGNNGAIFFGGTTPNLWAECNITHNIFKNNTAVFGTVFYNGINGTSHSYLNYNLIYGTDCYDVFNEYELNKIDAKYNWWGSNYGPGTYSTYSKFNLNVDTSHYMVLTINSPQDMIYGENTTMNIDMLHDNTTAYHDPKFGVIPDGVQVKLNATSGTLIPNSVTLINGVASVTYIANGSTGSVEINAIADNDERYPSKTTINVQKIPTTTHNVYSQYSGATGSNVNFIAIITDKYNKPVNEGTVTFKVGTIDLIAPVLNGYATYNWTIPSTIGNSSIYTTYNGDSIYATSNDPYQSQLVIVPSADVVLTKEVLPQITLGQEFTAKVTAENKGPNTAKEIIFSNKIPTQFEFINAITDKGTWTYDSATRLFTWNIGNLELGETANLYLTLKSLQAGTYRLLSNLTTVTYDPNMENQNNPLVIKVKATDNNNGNAADKNKVQAGSTIEMQKTGLPIPLIVLALLMVLGGLISVRKK